MDSLICLQCGGELRRSRRRLLERFGYSKAYRCKDCDTRVRVALTTHSKNLKFAACPKCHTYELTAPKRVDKIDKLMKGPGSFVQRLMGGTLYHCWYCRLQFYDLRPRKKSERRMLTTKEADASSAAD